MLPGYVFILSISLCYSQEKDFGLWSAINAQYKLVKGLDLVGSASIRTFDNASEIEKYFIEGGLQYKIDEFYSIDGSYRLEENLENNSKYYFRHKLFFDVKISNGDRKLGLSGRLRFQRGAETYIENDTDSEAKYYGRLKFKADYNIPAFPLTPYAWMETYTPLFTGAGFKVNKERFSLGTDLKINKKNSISLEYIRQKSLINNKSVSNIISVNYKIRF